MKDLSVHRTTVKRIEPAATLCFPQTWRGRSQTFRLVTTTLVGFATASYFSQAVLAQDKDPVNNSKTTPAKVEASHDDDAQGAADHAPTVFAISKPMTTDEEWKTWSDGKGRAEYNARVHAGELDRDSMQIISNGIRLQVYAMTLPTQRDNLGTIVAGLLRSLHGAADTKAPTTQRDVRVAMMKEIITRCHEVGDNQFYVRLNAAILLGNLFVVAESPLNHTPEFYDPAFEPLMEVLERPGQPEAIKLEAIIGLRNAANFCIPPLLASRKIRLASKLREELEKTDTCEWYQAKICDTLGSLDQMYDLDGRPFIVHALAKALYDRNRPLCARAAAAKALGRAQLPPSVDLNVVAYGIADLSRQIVEARNERKKHVRRWCVTDVFLAFRPKNADEKAKRAGLLDRVDEPTYQKFRESIKDVYGLIRPMVAQELKESDSAFPPEIGEHIADWLKNHTPAQMRIAPGLPLITTTQVTKADASH